MMTYALMHNTRIAVQVVVDDDTGNIAALILALTTLVNVLIKLGQWINEVVLLVNDFAEAARFTTAVFSIGFKALAYGFVGVRL